MKHVPHLTTEPEGLAAWRTEHPDDTRATGSEAKGAWDRFRDSGGAYGELLRTLLDRQQGLCGYCEQRLSKSDGTLVFNDYQVEHILAKTGGPGRVLDARNLMLCCGGGTWPHHKEASRRLAGEGNKANTSCGQSKGDCDIDQGCDPRSFGWAEPVVLVGSDGSMRPNEDACRRSGIDPRHLQETIDLLELNCERLRLAREHVVKEIVGWYVLILEEMLRLSSHIPDAESASIRAQLVGGRIGPDQHGHLRPFWTTERLYLGDLAERWIHEHAHALNFARAG